MSERPIDFVADSDTGALGEPPAQPRELEQLLERERRAELALRESERRLNAVLSNTTSAIFLMNDRQHCVYMNKSAEQLTGYTLDETFGRPLHEVVHHTRPDGTPYPLAECPIDRAFPQNSQTQGEEVFVHKDGRFYPVAFTASPIRDEQANVVGTIIEVRDISDEKRTREALQEADRRKDEFLATLAHELRNPLAPIRNAVQLLRMRDLDDPVLQNAREILDRQTQHMVRLIDDLMDVGRITRGKLELRRVAIPLEAIVEQTLETCRPHLAHELSVTLPATPVVLDADPVRLAQVFGNLLTNACKYTPPGGRIWLEAERIGDQVEIRVRDTGVGIAREHLPRLFQMFSQGEPVLQRAHGGLGIGLALSRALVAMHGGTVDARSDGLGQGSEFVVRLPIAAVSESLERERAPARDRRRVRTRSGTA
ncbi:MAG TPA: PAS domain-containing sensor histidine kinase [Burkholderiaceae bacterium]|nr:PAS domain-containing sensor histidine kinase [Burkholderiaceae bacterium]